MQYIRNWFRNHCKVKAWKGAKAKISKLVTKMTRKKKHSSQAIQVYVKLYYAAKMRHVVDAEVLAYTPSEPELKSDRAAHWFKVYQRVVREFWDEESDAIKQEVADELKKCEKEKPGKRIGGDDLDEDFNPVDVEPTLAEYQE